MIFEQNMCSGGERFERALADAGALATLSALAGRIEAAASSQAWTAAAHYDSCGEGHIAAPRALVAPAAVPALAAAFNSYLPIVIAPGTTAKPAAGANPTRAATAAADARIKPTSLWPRRQPRQRDGRGARALEAAAPLPPSCSATAVTLSSPLAGAADAYAAGAAGESARRPELIAR